MLLACLPHAARPPAPGPAAFVSRVGWAGFVAACATSELDKAVSDWQLRLVTFFGGVDDGRPGWNVPEEVVAQVAHRPQHLGDRPQPCYALVNGLAIFDLLEP
jgi:hypothetical protein